MSLEPGQINEQLKKADLIRSSDDKAFSKILSEIRPDFNQLSNEQKYYLLYLSGYENFYKGIIKEAISQYKRVEENSKNIELRFRASLSLLNIYALTNDWLSGFSYLDNISKLKEKISNTDIKHHGLISAALFYNELEQFEMANIFVEQLLVEQASGRNRCFTFSVKLKADLFTLNFDSLEREVFDAIESCTVVNELVVVNILRTYLATYYLKQNKPGLLIELLEKHFDEIKNTNHQLLTAETSNLLAQAYFQNNDFINAEKHALIVVNRNRSDDYIRAIISAYRILSIITRQNGNYELAFDFQDKYIQSKEFLFEQTKAKQFAIESAKHIAIEKDNQIALLNKQNQILQLEQNLTREEADANRWIISLLILSISLMIFWLFYVIRSQQRLKYLAEYDGLTRICSRAHFTQSAETTLSIFAKSHRAVSLVMFDLDHFKKINDLYGHLAGDKVLQMATHVCKGSIRKMDAIGRIGGEEFAIFLPNCKLEEAQKIAEDCREKINQINTKETGFSFKVSASFGVTETKLSGYELKTLFAHADSAMYVAKKKGRDQVVAFNSGLSAS